MQLTTPEIKDYDSVFPAENWFLYWKTSAALWKEKLATYRQDLPVLIPLYWGLHGEFKGQVDFGDYKTETDIVRLKKCLDDLGLEACFLLPIAPVPFLPNGGVPSYLARQISLDREMKAQVYIGEEGKLYKMYSYFEPLVFKGFQFFVKKISELNGEHSLNLRFYGLSSFVFKNSSLESTFVDRSVVFQNGLKKYLNQVEDMEKSEVKDYPSLIKDLYTDLIKEVFQESYRGEIPFGFVGSCFEDIFNRGLKDEYDNEKYSSHFFSSLCADIVPSAILLNSKETHVGIWQKFGEYFSSIAQNKIFEQDNKSIELNTIVELIDLTSGWSFNNSYFKSIGISDFLEKTLPWGYRISKDLSVLKNDKAYFIQGGTLSRATFSQLLKNFMLGNKIFLDLNGFSSENRRVLEAFVAENNLDQERVNFYTTIEKITLGEGFLILFNSEELIQLEQTKQIDFWQGLFKLVDFNLLKIEVDESIQYISLNMLSDRSDLNFDYQKRYFFYNPSSYKKRVSIELTPGHALVKSLNAFGAEIQTLDRRIEIKLNSGGNICLDFGVFSNE